MKTKTFLILAAAALILAAPSAGWAQTADSAAQGTTVQSGQDTGAAAQQGDQKDATQPTEQQQDDSQ